MWGSCGGVSGCSHVCAGPLLRGGVGCVMRSHMFSSSVPQAGREHRSWGRPDAPQAAARRGRDKPAPLNETPGAPVPTEALVLLSPLAWHHPSFLASPAGLATPLPAHSWEQDCQALLCLCAFFLCSWRMEPPRDF